MANFPLMFRMVTSSAPHRPASVLDRVDAVPRAGPVVLSHALLRERPDAYRRRRLRLHLLAAPGLRRGFNPAPRRQEHGDAEALRAAEVTNLCIQPNAASAINIYSISSKLVYYME